MSQQNINDKRQKILDEIYELRSKVSNNAKIRLSVQEDIFEIIDETVESLHRDISEVSLYRAASKVNMARKRAAQAESQGQLLPWLPLVISLFLSVVLGLATWAIIKYESLLFSATPGWSYIILGAVLLGAVGSAADGFRELHTRIARQELDLNRLAWYLFHPLIGGVLGGILFLVIYAGLLALTEGEAGYRPALVYAVAALTGFGQRQVIQYFRETLADMLRIKREVPEEAG